MSKTEKPQRIERLFKESQSLIVAVQILSNLAIENELLDRITLKYLLKSEFGLPPEKIELLIKIFAKNGNGK